MPEKVNETFSMPSTVGPTGWADRRDALSIMQKSSAAQSALFYARQKQQESLDKAGNVLPFPLNGVEDMIADASAALVKAKSNLINAYGSGLIKKSERSVVKRNILRVKRIRKVLAKIVRDLSTMKV